MGHWEDIAWNVALSTLIGLSVWLLVTELAGQLLIWSMAVGVPLGVTASGIAFVVLHRALTMPPV